jgi:hypothetical protein
MLACRNTPCVFFSFPRCCMSVPSIRRITLEGDETIRDSRFGDGDRAAASRVTAGQAQP